MRKDLVWKEYLSDDERYADIINGICFRGRQTLKAAQLKVYDPQGRMTERRKRGVSPVTKRREITRDTVRKAVFGNGCFIVGIEAQEETDYAMPLRSLCYDVGTYGKQAAEIRKAVRKHSQGLSSGEYLYGFRLESRLYPALTIILYTGKYWDGPWTLHDILDFQGLPEEIRRLVPDAGIHLVEIRRLKDTSVFRTDVRQVFDFIRFSDDKEKLRKLTVEDPYYRNMEEDAYEVAAECTDAEGLLRIRDHHRKGGKIDMCKAIEEMIAEGKEAGIREGKEAGIRGTVSVLRDMDIPVESILLKIQKEYCLSPEESWKYL